jgi:hypothetical protein
MIRIVAFAALIVGAGSWTTETTPDWYRPDASPSDLRAALSGCRAEATSGLHGLLPSEFDALARCMSEHGWAPGANPQTQIAALR